MSKNHLVEQLRQHMIADLEAAIGDQEEEILRAITRAADARSDSEEPLKFSVSLRGILNLDKDEVETAFSFSTRTAVKAKHRLEDPNQEKLALHGVSVSLKTTGPWSSVELDPEEKIHAKVAATIESAGFKQGKDGVYRKEGQE